MLPLHRTLTYWAKQSLDLPGRRKHQGNTLGRQRSSCTHAKILYIYAKIYLIHLDFWGPPGVSSRPLDSHPSTPSAQCVCVCAYIHTHTHIHSQPRENREDTDNTPIFPSVKITPHAKQQVRSWTS